MGRQGYVLLRRLGDVRGCWVFLFETCLRRRWDALMGRRCYILLRRHHDVPIRCRGDVPLRSLGTFHGELVGCFLWDVTATSLERTERRHYDVGTTSFCRVELILIWLWIDASVIWGAVLIRENTALLWWSILFSQEKS